MHNRERRKDNVAVHTRTRWTVRKKNKGQQRNSKVAEDTPSKMQAQEPEHN